MSTLYRKYRPQKFSDLVGQDHLVQTLTNEIAMGKIAHAYLFSGPRGIGKTTMARLFAKAVNCESRKEDDFEPCNKCSSCEEISNGRNIDVIEIDAASHTGVDNVRENIIDNAQFRPTRSKYKIFIIDEVHMLSTSAFNALLKTLEEPPSHVVFILATTELHKLPATIISRCQRFNFKKINQDIILNKLKNIAENEDVKIDKKVLERIISKSEGCLRDAESLLGQVMSLNLKKISTDDVVSILPTSDINEVLDYIEAVVDSNAEGAISIIDRSAREGINLEQFALDALEALRSIMIFSAGQAPGTDYGDQAKIKIKELSSKISPEKIIKMIESLMKRRNEIKQSPIPQLPLELFSIEFSQTEEKTGKTNTPKDPPTPIDNSVSYDGNHGKSNDTIVNKRETATKKTSASPVSLDEARTKWPDVINNISEKFPSMAFILKMASIADIDGNIVSLSVPYSFHKEKVDELKFKKFLEDELSRQLSSAVQIRCDHCEQTQTSETDLTKLAAEFGGEVL